MGLEGLDSVKLKFKEYSADAKKAVAAELRIVGLDLQGKAQRRAPVDTGDLRGSAYTTVEDTRDGVAVEVGFNTKYAKRQHEELGYKHPRGGEAKYLERPFKENSSRYRGYISKALEDITR